MIELLKLHSSDEPGTQTLTTSIRYDDGTFDILVVVDDARSGNKFTKLFEREPGNAHVTRASLWIEAGLRREKHRCHS